MLEKLPNSINMVRDFFLEVIGIKKYEPLYVEQTPEEKPAAECAGCVEEKQRTRGKPSLTIGDALSSYRRSVERSNGQVCLKHSVQQNFAPIAEPSWHSTMAWFASDDAAVEQEFEREKIRAIELNTEQEEALQARIDAEALRNHQLRMSSHTETLFNKQPMASIPEPSGYLQVNHLANQMARETMRSSYSRYVANNVRPAASSQMKITDEFEIERQVQNNTAASSKPSVLDRATAPLQVGDVLRDTILPIEQTMTIEELPLRFDPSWDDPSLTPVDLGTISFDPNVDANMLIENSLRRADAIRGKMPDEGISSINFASKRNNDLAKGVAEYDDSYVNKIDPHDPILIADLLFDDQFSTSISDEDFEAMMLATVHRVETKLADPGAKEDGTITFGKTSGVVTPDESEQYCESWLRDIATDPNAPIAVIERLAKSPFDSIRVAVARNPRTPLNLMMELANDADSEVRCAVASCEDMPFEVQRQLSFDKNDFVALRANQTIRRAVGTFRSAC